MRPLVCAYHERPMRTVKYNRDGDLIITGSDDGLVSLLNASTGVRIGCYDGHNGAAVKACDINLESSVVCSGGADSKVVFYHAKTGEIILALNHGGLLKGMEFNQNPADNNEIVTCSDRFQKDPNRICIWRFDFSVPGEETIKPILTIKDEQLPIKATRVRWGPFDETLISIHEEGQFYVWDKYSGDRIRTIQAHNQPITGLQFNMDRTLMITASRDASVKVFDMKNHAEVKTFSSNRPFNDAAISPLYGEAENPKYHILAAGGVEAIHAATTGGDGGFDTVLFNMVLEEEIGTVQGGFGPTNTLAIAPDGKSYCTGGEDGFVRVVHWDKDYLSRKDL